MVVKIGLSANDESMCGRFTLTSLEPITQVAEVLRSDPSTLPFEPRFNIAPSQSAVVLRASPLSGELSFDNLRWGLIPAWAKDANKSMINARSETVAEKSSFKSSFLKRRCLVIADGFYEWQATESGKRPHWFSLVDSQSMVFAGIWRRWQYQDKDLDTFAILTCAASEFMSDYHQRMPVILYPEHYQSWVMTPPEQAEQLSSLMVPRQDLQAHQVSKRVNNPRFDEPDCLTAVAE